MAMRDEIESALLAANGSRTGAGIPSQAKGVRETMIGLGLMTKNGNLTRKGAQTRASLADERERRAFGL